MLAQVVVLQVCHWPASPRVEHLPHSLRLTMASQAPTQAQSQQATTGQLVLVPYTPPRHQSVFEYYNRTIDSIMTLWVDSQTCQVMTSLTTQWHGSFRINADGSLVYIEMDWMGQLPFKTVWFVVVAGSRVRVRCKCTGLEACTATSASRLMLVIWSHSFSFVADVCNAALAFRRWCNVPHRAQFK